MKNKFKIGLASLMTLGACALFATNVSASVPTFYSWDVEPKAKELTNSDSFNFNGTEYVLNSYAGTVNTTYHKNFSGATSYYKSVSNLFGKNYYLQVNDSTNAKSIVGDDPITSIIPKEYFMMVGNHSYVGKEYGFFVKTSMVQNAYVRKFNLWTLSFKYTPVSSYRSNVIVFDVSTINARLQYDNARKSCLTVRPLFTATYDTVEDGNYVDLDYDGQKLKKHVIADKDVPYGYVTYPRVEFDKVFKAASPNYKIGNVGFSLKSQEYHTVRAGYTLHDPQYVKPDYSEFSKETLSMILEYASFIPVVGEIISAATAGYDTACYVLDAEKLINDSTTKTLKEAISHYREFEFMGIEEGMSLCSGNNAVSFTANEKTRSTNVFEANGCSSIYLCSYPRVRDLNANPLEYYSRESIWFNILDANNNVISDELKLENTFGTSDNVITTSDVYTFKSGDTVKISCAKGKYVNVETIGDLDTGFLDIETYGDDYYYEDDSYYEDVNSDGDSWTDYNARLNLRVNNTSEEISFKIRDYRNTGENIRLKVTIS